jgi:hypothetical protein
MSTTFTPNDSIPPSPNGSAWNANATVTAITAAQGPSSMATKAPPTACAVVPSGIGTLNIMMRRQTAARTAGAGRFRVFARFSI